MTSFAVAIEPAPNPRLAALAFAMHLAAAASPWFARVPHWLAVPLTLVALASVASTLAAVPGIHHRLSALARDGQGWRIRMREGGAWLPSKAGPRSRAFAGLAFLDLQAGGRRYVCLLTRNSVPVDSFRRLKAWIRLTC